LKSTKAQDVFTALAAEIVHGRLSPGTPLDETLIAHRFQVSRTPIREAIRQLQLTGLIEARPHRGAMVRDISEQQLDQMFAVMAELEAVCARWASFAMTAAERKALQAMHSAAATLVKAGDRAGYVEANDAFHAAIYDGAHNDYLGELTRAARQRIAPFRRAQFDELGRLTKSHAEHGRITIAIDRGDGDAAYSAIRAHIVVGRTAVENIGRPGAAAEALKELTNP
jgi:DNA-binding GntR family transcriptional regulator